MDDLKDNFIALRNLEGEACAEVHCFPVATLRDGLAVLWAEGVASAPDRPRSRNALHKLIEERRSRGVLAIDTRVVTSQAGLDPSLVMSRAEWLRSILRELGFEPISKRIEYQLPLLDAIARLEAVAPSPRLTWMTVPTEPGPGIEHAARILRTVGENAPESVIHSDPVGFLLSRREDRDVTLSPESLQIGFLNENEAAIVAASAIPTTGWCTLFYLGVVPAFRRKRIGTEAMLHGLRALQAMGGRTYHDGTDTRNAAMLSLFERLRVAEFRELEEWERSW